MCSVCMSIAPFQVVGHELAVCLQLVLTAERAVTSDLWLSAAAE